MFYRALHFYAGKKYFLFSTFEKMDRDRIQIN